MARCLWCDGCRWDGPCLTLAPIVDLGNAGMHLPGALSTRQGPGIRHFNPPARPDATPMVIAGCGPVSVPPGAAATDADAEAPA